MKIPSLVWLILGILLSGASWYLGEEFILFFYAGLILIGLGIFKAVIGYVFSKKESKLEKKMVGQEENYSKCRYCENVVRKIDYYCSMCGKRLR